MRQLTAVPVVALLALSAGAGAIFVSFECAAWNLMATGTRVSEAARILNLIDASFVLSENGQHAAKKSIFHSMRTDCLDSKLMTLVEDLNTQCRSHPEFESEDLTSRWGDLSAECLREPTQMLLEDFQIREAESEDLDDLDETGTPVEIQKLPEPPVPAPAA